MQNAFIISVLAALAAALVYGIWSMVFNRKEREPFADLAAALDSDEEEQRSHDVETYASKATRRFRRIFASVGGRIPLSDATVSRMRMKLLRAGVDMTPAMFYGMILLMGVFAAAIGLLLAVLLNASMTLRIAIFVIVLALALLAPSAYLHSARKKRVSDIERRLPDDIDLLVVTTRAGRSVTTAIQAVAAHCNDEIAHEFGIACREMAAGATRAAAIEGVRDRCDVPAVDSFASALIQAERRGGETAGFLEQQSKSAREAYRLKMEEKVNKTTTKITLVLCLFIFPTMLIIALFPTAMQLFRSLSSVF